KESNRPTRASTHHACWRPYFKKRQNWRKRKSVAERSANETGTKNLSKSLSGRSLCLLSVMFLNHMVLVLGMAIFRQERLDLDSVRFDLIYCHAPARYSIPRYLTSIVVTLRAGNVIFSDVPLAACVPTRTGWTGVCPWAEV